MMVMGSQYCSNRAGSIIMPTDTKKMEPNMFFMGCTRCSMRSASMVSASTEPITKAPSALLNPACTANITMPRQSPMEKMVSVSSLRCFLNFFRNVGMSVMPNTNQRAMYMTSLPTCQSSSLPSNSFLTAMEVSSTMSTTAKRSSTIRMPKHTPAKRWLRSPASSMALKTMVVDDMQSMPPRKMAFMLFHPSR